MTTQLKLPGIRERVEVAPIEKALEAVPRVRRVTIDRENETALVEHDGADWQELDAAARAAGFHVEPHGASGSGRGARIKTILTPIDFSPVMERVINEATKLARALDGRVVLVHVTEPTAGVVDYAAIVVAVAQVNEAAVKHAVERLNQLEQQVQAQGVEADSVHLTGTPVTEIIEQARKLSADYIVIGSHGHTAFYDLLVGGTAHGILKRARCPVVVVSPHPKQKSEHGP
jgi:nucleotide-binding universal stress UspA family protein/copper chaperone CopZ